MDELESMPHERKFKSTRFMKGCEGTSHLKSQSEEGRSGARL